MIHALSLSFFLFCLFSFVLFLIALDTPSSLDADRGFPSSPSRLLLRRDNDSCGLHDDDLLVLRNSFHMIYVGYDDRLFFFLCKWLLYNNHHHYFMMVMKQRSLLVPASFVFLLISVSAESTHFENNQTSLLPHDDHHILFVFYQHDLRPSFHELIMLVMMMVMTEQQQE